MGRRSLQVFIRRTFPHASSLPEDNPQSWPRMHTRNESALSVWVAQNCWDVTVSASCEHRIGASSAILLGRNQQLLGLD